MIDLLILIRRILARTIRSPFVVFSLLQPFLWLFLFGNLFSAVGKLYGMEGQSYIGFLAPGVVIMSSSINASYSGVATLMDLDRGTLERLFITPVSTAAVALAPILQTAVITTVPVIILLGAAAVSGAGIQGGLGGFLILLLAAFGTALIFSGISNTIGLLTRQVPAVLGIMNMLALPLTFTSSMLVSRAVMPGWMQTVSILNPIDWGVSVARTAYNGAAFGHDVLLRGGLLAVMAVIVPAAAVLAMRRYRRGL